ncbi:hypothetical protein K8I61_11275 [bacterium]|nr:hypothetical protein [bacterium]
MNLADGVRAAFYPLDLFIGFGAPILLYALIRAGRIDPFYGRLFALGAALGALWEIPIFVLSASSSTPIIVWIRPLPLHWSIFLIAHTLWDGAIFVAGAGLLRTLFGPRVLDGFRWRELAFLMVWGVATAILVELSAIANDAWVYLETYAWNPPLFEFRGHALTFLMPAVWLAASAAFFAIARRMKRSV